MSIIEYIALIPTTILLIIILSQYFLMFLPRKKIISNYNPNVSIIVPCHNEEKNIEESVKNLCNSKYSNEMEIIYVENGSTDATYDKLKNLSKKYPIKVFRLEKAGKSAALNLGIKKSKHDIVIVCDADSYPDQNAIDRIVKPLHDPKIGAVSGIVRVKNKSGWLTWFQSIEYAYLYFYNNLLWKINGVIFTPGVLSAYRRNLLEKVGNFAGNSYAEDFKVALKIHDNNYHIALAEDVVTYTKVPRTIRGLFRQRLRWAVGILQTVIEEKSFSLHKKNKAVGLYAIPMLVYWFIHALIMIPIIFYLSLSGYFQWVFPYFSVISLSTAKYFFFWFSLFGIMNLLKDIYLGNVISNPLVTLSIIVTLLTWPLYIYSVIRYDRKIDIREIIASFFLFPYSIFISIGQILALVISLTRKKIRW